MEDNRPYKIQRPKGLTEYIRTECARHHYMFFSKKQNKAICSCCGSEIDLKHLPPLVHEPDNGRLNILCEVCKASVTPKDMRYGRKKLTDRGRVTWTRGIGSVTFIETDIYVIDYKQPYPTVMIRPDMQIRITKEKQERFDWREGYFKDGWWQIKKIGLKMQPATTWGYSGYMDHMYMPDEVLQVGTDLEYADLHKGRFFDEMGTPDEYAEISRLINYMSDFAKYQATEILEKSGFEIIVFNRAAGYRTKYLNMRATDLRKILKVDGGDVKALRKVEPTIGFLDDLHNYRKMAPWAKVEDISEIDCLCGGYIDTRKLNLIETHANISKLIRKMLDEYRATGDLFTLNDYADYLEAAIRLGMRLDKRTLYPKDLMGEHDRVIEEAEKQKESIDAANFMRYQKEITRMTEPFISDDLLIRPARSPQELRKESRVLNHCVRMYIDKVARGETSILFIRQEKNPDEPYFTLELNRKGKIVQCRGEHNKGYPEEVGQFIDKWKTEWDKEAKRA